MSVSCRNKNLLGRGKCSDCEHFENNCSAKKVFLDACYILNIVDGRDIETTYKNLKEMNFSYVGFVTHDVLGEIYRAILSPEMERYREEIEKILLKCQILERKKDLSLLHDLENELSSVCKTRDRDIIHLAIAIARRIRVFVTSDNGIISSERSIQEISSEICEYKIRIREQVE
jgi:hypothetical protein